MELAHDVGPTDVPLLDDTIGSNLARTVAAHGDREALVARHQGVRWSYSEFAERVARLARGLIGLGLEKGDRVGLWSPNYAEWTLVQYATAEIGVILVNVNPAYRTHELAFALNQSGCRILFAAPSFKSSDYVDMVEQVRPEVPALERAVFFWEDDWDELVAGAGGASDTDLDERRRGLRPDDPINIQYTSGTTGFPKGATLTHRNILNNGYFVTRLQGFGPTDRLCIPVPFYHCFGMVMGNLGCTTHGATMVIPSDAFEPTHVLETIEAERCTAVYGVPTMFIAELAHPEFERFDLSSLRTGVMAGAPCPIEVMKACVDRMHMTEVTICYGMTETSPVSTQTLPDDSLHHRTATVGRAHPHVEIRVADPDSGATLARASHRRVLHARVLGDAGLLERRRANGRGDRRRRLDPHRRPRGDGRRRLRQHRRPDQGHGDPRRRERLPAGDRGVHLHPPRRRGRAGDRRARRALRRGVDGVDPAAPGRRHRTRAGAPVLPGQDRPLQDPPLRQVRGRVPDDRHGQGTEVQDARSRPWPSSA